MAAALFSSIHPDNQVTTRHSVRPMTIQFGNWMVNRLEHPNKQVRSVHKKAPNHRDWEVWCCTGHVGRDQARADRLRLGKRVQSLDSLIR